MTVRAAILFALLLPSVTLAGMTAQEFDTYTKGKTLFYSLNGEDYGVERYMDNRRVEWSFLDGECVAGIWYEQNGQICFSYDGWTTPQCWLFEETPNGLTAQFTNTDGRDLRYRAYEKDEDMICLGPKTGV